MLSAAAFGYAASGHLVICDGIVGPWFLAPFRGQASATGLPLHYVVLRPDQPHALDSAGQRPAETAAAVLHGVAAGRYRLPDWRIFK